MSDHVLYFSIMRYARYLLIIPYIWTIASCSPDIFQAMPGNNHVTLTKQDTIYAFSFMTEQSEVSVSQEKNYTWFARGDIATSQGGYTGKLLHGAYEVVLRSNKLLEKGAFLKGRKDGKWYTWHTNGKLKSITHYKKGVLSGPFSEFNDQGLLVKEGKYKNGLLHGKLVSYHNNDTLAKRFKNGKVVEKDTSQHRWTIKEWFDKKHESPKPSETDTLSIQENPPVAETHTEAEDQGKHRNRRKRHAITPDKEKNENIQNKKANDSKKVRRRRRPSTNNEDNP